MEPVATSVWICMWKWFKSVRLFLHRICMPKCFVLPSYPASCHGRPLRNWMYSRSFHPRTAYRHRCSCAEVLLPTLWREQIFKKNSKNEKLKHKQQNASMSSFRRVANLLLDDLGRVGHRTVWRSSCNSFHPGPRRERKGESDGHFQGLFWEEKLPKLPTLVNYACNLGPQVLCASAVVQIPISPNPRGHNSNLTFSKLPISGSNSWQHPEL